MSLWNRQHRRLLIKIAQSRIGIASRIMLKRKKGWFLLLGVCLCICFLCLKAYLAKVWRFESDPKPVEEDACATNRENCSVNTNELYDFMMTTPEDFIDIPKEGTPRLQRRREESFKKVPKVANAKLFSEWNPKSPKRLKEIALKSPPYSKLSLFLNDQENRKALIEKGCREAAENVSKMALSQTLFQHILLDRVDYLTFCPVYKAASTSWSIILLQMRGLWERHSLETPRIQSILTQTFETITNSMAPLISKGTTRFLVVRHPLHRLVSCYRDKFEGAEKPYYYFIHGEYMVLNYRDIPPGVSQREIPLMLEAARRKAAGRSPRGSIVNNPYLKPLGPTFEEFIKYIIYGKYEDEHWRPYYLHCYVCRMNYDFIIKFETLGTEAEMFLEYLGRSDLNTTRWDNPTSGGSTTKETACKYFSQIHSKLLHALVQKYKMDFKLFDYSPQFYFNCTKKD